MLSRRTYCTTLINRLLFHSFRRPNWCTQVSNESTSSTETIEVLPAKHDKSFVEEDAEKVTKHVFINYLKDGRHPEIKADSEYPDWIFKLDITWPKKLEELDPDKDEWHYWRVLHRTYWRQKVKNRNIFFGSSNAQFKLDAGRQKIYKQNNMKYVKRKNSKWGGW